MKCVVAFFLIFILALGNSTIAQAETAPTNVPAPVTKTAGPPPSPNTLQNGTAIKLRLTENVTSATAKPGQQVAFEAVDETDLQGVTVVAKGAQALATVTSAEPRRSMGRAGKLDINIDSIRLVDGENAALSATQDAKGGGHTGAMTAGMVGTALVFFPAAPLLLFIHGKDITIPKGTEITAFVSGDTKLDMAKFAVAPAVAVSAPSASGLSIEASVPNCDIEIDGSFMGSTPSTLSLAPGKHMVVVKKSGYQDWSRSMIVGSGAVRIDAEMLAVK